MVSGFTLGKTTLFFTLYLKWFYYITGRDFEDTIACGGHPVDIQSIPSELKNADLNHWRFHIPYRCLVPKEVDNLLIAGRCVSTTRVAKGVVRTTAQCMAMGEAAGVAAALAVKRGVAPRAIDVQELRTILKANGSIL